jgi:hypothetical protein
MHYNRMYTVYSNLDRWSEWREQGPSKSAAITSQCPHCTDTQAMHLQSIRLTVSVAVPELTKLDRAWIISISPIDRYVNHWLPLEKAFKDSQVYQQWRHAVSSCNPSTVCKCKLSRDREPEQIVSLDTPWVSKRHSYCSEGQQVDEKASPMSQNYNWYSIRKIRCGMSIWQLIAHVKFETV